MNSFGFVICIDLVMIWREELTQIIPSGTFQYSHSPNELRKQRFAPSWIMILLSLSWMETIPPCIAWGDWRMELRSVTSTASLSTQFVWSNIWMNSFFCSDGLVGSMGFNASFFDSFSVVWSFTASLGERSDSNAMLVSWITLPEIVPQYNVWVFHEQLVMSSWHHWQDFKLISSWSDFQEKEKKKSAELIEITRVRVGLLKQQLKLRIGKQCSEKILVDFMQGRRSATFFMYKTPCVVGRLHNSMAGSYLIVKSRLEPSYPKPSGDHSIIQGSRLIFGCAFSWSSGLGYNDYNNSVIHTRFLLFEFSSSSSAVEKLPGNE